MQPAHSLLKKKGRVASSQLTMCLHPVAAEPITMAMFKGPKKPPLMASRPDSVNSKGNTS